MLSSCLSFSQNLHHFMSHSQFCVSMQFKIPKEFPKNSQRIPTINLQQCYAIQNSQRIPKQFPNNFPKIPKKLNFFKNSKRIPKNSQKVLTRAYRSKFFSSLLYLTLRIESCSHFEQNSERKNISLTMNRLDQK